MAMRFWIIVLCLLSQPALAESPQQFANIGDLPLVSGETLRDCRIGYRIAGTLNADKSNVIVFPTWFSGTSADLLSLGLVGPGKIADSDRYYVIIIDALADGVSTSPSNSEQQPGAAFPAITIDDMVNAEHILLTKHLGIAHARAVMGISMGGMQTFQWLGQYPEFMDKAVPIDGSPKLTSYDLLLWQNHAKIIGMLQEAGVDNEKIMGFLTSLGLLNLFTPDYFVENVAPEDLQALVAGNVAATVDQNVANYLAQLRAMLTHDAYADFAATEQPYEQRIKADVMIVGAPSDHMVNPAPGKALATAIGARYAEIHSNCGHLSSSCEAWTIAAMVHEFLDQDQDGNPVRHHDQEAH